MKFIYFAVIITGIMIILNAGGVHTPITSQILSVAGVNMTHGNESIGLSQSKLWDNPNGEVGSSTNGFGIIQILLGLSVAGALLSFFGRSPDINYVIGALVAGFSTYIFIDMISIASLLMSYGNTLISWIAMSIFVPLSIGYFYSVIQFWRGNA